MKEKDVREGLEKAFEKQRAAGAMSSPLGGSGEKGPASARKASRPQDFSREASDLLEMKDHDAMCRVLNERAQGEQRAEELREQISMTNQKVVFLSLSLVPFGLCLVTFGLCLVTPFRSRFWRRMGL